MEQNNQSILFNHQQESNSLRNKNILTDFYISFQINLAYIQQCSNLNSLKHCKFSKIPVWQKLKCNGAAKK